MSICKLNVKGNIIPIPKSNVVTSKLFSDFINCYGTDIFIPFPEQFNDIADIYISHLKKQIR